MQPMNGRVTKAEEKIVKVEEYGDFDADYTLTFALEMTREDYLRLRQARQNKEGLVVTVLFAQAD